MYFIVCQVEKEPLDKGGEPLQKKGANFGTLFQIFKTLIDEIT